MKNELVPEKNDFQMYLQDCLNKQGGGVMITITNHVSSYVIYPSRNPEALSVCLSLSSGKYVVGVSYRSPDCDKSFSAELRNIISVIKSRFRAANTLLFW